MTKGQSMSINVIIVAAIALVVLIVLVVIFGGRVSLFNRGLNTCSGYCSPDGACMPGDVAIPTQNCRDSAGQHVEGEGVCCIKSG